MCALLYTTLFSVTKPAPYSNSTHFSDHFAYHITLSLCYHVTVRLMSGSSNSHHAPTHMTKSSLTCVVKCSGKVRKWSKEVSKGKVLRLHTVFGVLTQSEDLVSPLHSIYSSTGS